MIWFWVIVFIIFLSAGLGAVSAAPWLPTKGADVPRMIDLAGVKAGDVVYDLGCGDGRLVFAAAQKGARAIGIEIFILPYLYAKIKSFFVPGSQIRYGDFFGRKINDATVVFVFLLDHSYKRIMKKFEAELKPGSRVVVSCWPIKEWESKLVKKDKRLEKELPIFLYRT